MDKSNSLTPAEVAAGFTAFAALALLDVVIWLPVILIGVSRG